MRSKLRQVYLGIANIVAYAPIIYQDRDWDHLFLYELIIFKLKRMETCFKSELPHIPSNKQTISEIRVARKALERVAKERYISDRVYRVARRLGHLKEIFELEQRRINADLKLFTNQVYKYSRGWWS